MGVQCVGVIEDLWGCGPVRGSKPQSTERMSVVA